MSEQDRQQAIAKLEAQRYRKWLSWLILAPVLLCAGLAIGGPSINNMLARQESNRVCAERIASEALQATPEFLVDSEDTGVVITASNVAQLINLGDTVLDNPSIAFRPHRTNLAHPQGNYTIFVDAQGDSPTRFFICEEDGTALGAFTADETADVWFQPNGAQFFVVEAGFERILVFDAVDIERAGTIALGDGRDIESLVFHPTQALLFITADETLFVYNTDDLTQIHSVSVGEISDRELAISSDGSRLFIVQATTNVPHAVVFGIADD
ncbi:MAG: WD40 repeat domain-containing protein [Chloroflexota bacterium]